MNHRIFFIIILALTLYSKSFGQMDKYIVTNKYLFKIKNSDSQTEDLMLHDSILSGKIYDSLFSIDKVRLVIYNKKAKDTFLKRATKKHLTINEGFDSIYKMKDYAILKTSPANLLYDSAFQMQLNLSSYKVTFRPNNEIVQGTDSIFFISSIISKTFYKIELTDKISLIYGKLHGLNNGYVKNPENIIYIDTSKEFWFVTNKKE